MTERTAGRPAGVWLRLLRIVVLVYVGLTLWMTFMQRRYIYFPRTLDPGAAAEHAQRVDMQPWRSTGGDLLGWRRGLPQRGMQREALLILHGNAGHALNRVYFAEALAGTPGMAAAAIYILEYPGYGPRPGEPSEQALQAAAAEALADMQAAGYQRIFVLGESLGSGVAARLAADAPGAVDGLFLVTPFTSLVEVAQTHYPFLPVRWMLRERYDSRAALAAYDGPVAFMVAERDEVVPTRLGRDLYQQYDGPKRLFEVAGGTHNTLDFSPEMPGWREAWQFLRGE